MNTYLKVACYAALLTAWGVFAYAGKTPVDGFINAIGGLLAALGAVHIGAASSSTAAPPAAPTKDAP